MNRLGQSNSPYLQLHKDDPVHWYSWGPEAIAAAEAQNKPILLSIGYLSCDWCHMMTRENFSDAATAEAMNDGFINILVDRDDRPDIDMLYQSSANAMGGAGGWPLTAFLTPKGVPYSMGNFVPKESRDGKPAFKPLLADMRKLYAEQPDTFAAQVKNLDAHLDALWNRDLGGPLDPNVLDTTAIRIAQKYDIFFGGLATGQRKFPQPHFLELLLRAYLRTGLQQFMHVTGTTLDSLLVAGTYDHLGGGFYRYANDERWMYPHFEKVAADNARLIDVMVLFYQHRQVDLISTRLNETIEWLLRDMRVEDAFATSIDTGTEGDDEGKYYTWTEAEVDATLAGTFSQNFKAVYGVTREGNFRGRNILRRQPNFYPASPADEGLFVTQRALLLAARQKRKAPMRDGRVLADANGMVIAALANAGATSRRQNWTDAAIKAFDFVVKNLGDGDKLYHSWRAGVHGHAGFADDYAHMARAALVLWEATGEKRFLDQAKRWVQTLNDNFWDTTLDGYRMVSHDEAPTFKSARTIFDQAQPPANAVMLGVLARLQMVTADPAYTDRCNRILRAFGGEMQRSFMSSASFLNGVEILSTNLNIVVMGPIESAKTHDLIAAVRSRSLPNKVLAVVPNGKTLPEGHPARDQAMQNGVPTAFICQRGQISPPITNPVALSQMLQLPPTQPAPGARTQ